MVLLFKLKFLVCLKSLVSCKQCSGSFLFYGIESCDSRRLSCWPAMFEKISKNKMNSQPGLRQKLENACFGPSILQFSFACMVSLVSLMVVQNAWSLFGTLCEFPGLLKIKILELQKVCSQGKRNFAAIWRKPSALLLRGEQIPFLPFGF